jgi:hypothetical protein
MGMAMTKRVRVSERTLQLLNKLKRERGMRSHDEIIRELLSGWRKIPKSMFGSNPRLRSFVGKDEADVEDSAGALSSFGNAGEVLEKLLRDRKKSFR